MSPLFKHLVTILNTKHYRRLYIGGLSLILCSLASNRVRSAELPSTNGLQLQTSGPNRCANVGDWYTTDGTGNAPNCNGTATTNPNTEKIHRFYIDITEEMLDAAGGTVNITILDAESKGNSDEVQGSASDPTRFRLLDSAGTTILDTKTTDSNSPDGTSLDFSVNSAGTYQITSETGARFINGNSDTTLNDDDNTFTIQIPDGATPELQSLIGQFQGTMQQNTGSNKNYLFYFLVGPGTGSLYLRNFDLDNRGTLTYRDPTGTSRGTATRSGGTVWNGGGDLNTGGDTVGGLTLADAGAWELSLVGLNSNNQFIFEANTGDGDRLVVYDSPPVRAGSFTITPDTTRTTTVNTPVDHPFVITNQFTTTDIVNLSLSGTEANYTTELLTSTGQPLTDTDNDGNLDTDILDPNETISLILRVTPNTGVTNTDTTQINAVSFMDTKVDPNNNITRSVTKTTAVSDPPPQTGASCSVPYNQIYSGHFPNRIDAIHVESGAFTPLTTSNLAGNTNSLASDHVNKLVYYAENNSIYAWSPITNTHITITNNIKSFAGTNNINSLSSGGAAFYGGSLYLGVDAGSHVGGSEVYKIDFVPGSNGRTIQSVTSLNLNRFDSDSDWGDLIINNNGVIIASGGNGSFWRYDLANNAYAELTNNLPRGQHQLAKDGQGRLWAVDYSNSRSIIQVEVAGNTIQPIGSSISVDPHDTNDAAECVIGNSSIGDRIWSDNNGDGVQDDGENGIANVTVDLYWDVDGNGQIDGGSDPVLATQTTDDDGRYDFPDLIFGNYIVKVSDTNSVLTDRTLTSSTDEIAVTLAAGTVDFNDADVGYQPPLDYGDAPNDSNSVYSYTEASIQPSNSIYLGSTFPDSDAGNWHNGTDNSENATDDDTNDTPADIVGEDEEDGMVYKPLDLSMAGQSFSQDVRVNNSSGAEVYVKAWIDFDRNGTFDADEVSNEVPVAANVGDTTAELTFSIPSNNSENPDANGNFDGLNPGPSFARVIISDEPDIPIEGQGTGEIEDHIINIGDTNICNPASGTTFSAFDFSDVSGNIGENLNLSRAEAIYKNAAVDLDGIPIDVKATVEATQGQINKFGRGDIDDRDEFEWYAAVGNTDNEAEANVTLEFFIAGTTTPRNISGQFATGDIDGKPGARTEVLLLKTDEFSSFILNDPTDFSTPPSTTQINGDNYTVFQGTQNRSDDPESFVIYTFDSRSSINLVLRAIDVTGTRSAGFPINGRLASTEITTANCTTPTASVPELLLVKRITAINPGQSDERLFNTFNEDGIANNADNNSIWNNSTYLPGETNVPNVKPGDEVEYTIYFLSDGDEPANKVQICDAIPDNMTFVKDLYGVEVGIGLELTDSPSREDPSIRLSNVVGDETGTQQNPTPAQGAFYAPGTDPKVFCEKLANGNPPTFVDVNGENNTSGAVWVQLNNPLPPATSAGDPADSYGFIRFRARVK